MAPAFHAHHVLAVSIPTIAAILLTYVWFRKKKHIRDKVLNKDMNDSSFISTTSVVSSLPVDNCNRSYCEVVSAIKKAARDLETASPIFEIASDSEEECDIKQSDKFLYSNEPCVMSNKILSLGNNNVNQLSDLEKGNLLRALSDDDSREENDCSIIETNLFVSMKSNHNLSVASEEKDSPPAFSVDNFRDASEQFSPVKNTFHVARIAHNTSVSDSNDVEIVDSMQTTIRVSHVSEASQECQVPDSDTLNKDNFFEECCNNLKKLKLNENSLIETGGQSQDLSTVSEPSFTSAASFPLSEYPIEDNSSCLILQTTHNDTNNLKLMKNIPNMELETNSDSLLMSENTNRIDNPGLLMPENTKDIDNPSLLIPENTSDIDNQSLLIPKNTNNIDNPKTVENVADMKIIEKSNKIEHVTAQRDYNVSNSKQSDAEHNNKTHVTSKKPSKSNSSISKYTSYKTNHSNKQIVSCDGNERDSANHSPADAMFDGHSQQFSDVYSEGSSDSGKGCSEGAVTPTPDTPAGGSSVSGDIMVFQFEVPQEHVGKLIGKYGSFVNYIKENSNTRIYIKKHPSCIEETKICAIEGTQQDIITALDIIRNRFPEERYSDLTLEEFIMPLPITCPLRADFCQLHLIEGVNNDVIVSSVITAGHIFVQQPTHPTYPSLSALNMLMNSVYENPDAPQVVHAAVDTIVAAPAMDGWYRAQVMSVNAEAELCDVRFMDYGGYLTLSSTSLRAIRLDFLNLPFQATECFLANIIPIGDVWSEEAKLIVQSLTYGYVLKAQVYDYTECGTPLILLYAIHGNQVIFINEELVARGYAVATQINAIPIDPTDEMIQQSQLSTLVIQN